MIDCSTAHTVSGNAALSGQDKNCTSFLVGGVTSLTPISSSKPTQISVWRRRRKERGGMSPLCDRTGSSFLENTSNSPKKTPTKSLPFTPSRVNWVFFYSLSTLPKLILLRVDGMKYLVMWQSLFVYPPPPDLQHIRKWTPRLGHPCTHLYSCLWPKVSHQHTTPQRDHTQAPEREWRVKKKASQKSITLCSMRILT